MKQSKTQKYRAVALNNPAVTAIHQWFDYRLPCKSPYLFNSKEGDVLTVRTVLQMVKQWCQDAGLKENYGSHSLRKTWGYHQRQNGVPLTLITMAFGHGSQAQTLQYSGIQEH
ncbi:MAG: tyrosine-type recombinase/integrase [Cyanobacteria bacterium P01_H01_bin.15]